MAKPKEQLKRMIHDAFSSREYPSDDNIIQMPYLGTLGLGDMDDPLPLVGKRWQDIGPDFFWGIDWESKSFRDREYISVKALSFLTSEGFRYFLPAYMLMTIDHYDEFDDAEYAVLITQDSELYDWVLERFDGFNIFEVKTIIAFLEYLAELDPFMAEYPRESLEVYWYSRLNVLGKLSEE